MSWSLPTRARHPLCESEERCGLKVEILDSPVAHALALAHTDSRGLKKVFSRNVRSSGKNATNQNKDLQSQVCGSEATPADLCMGRSTLVEIIA